MWSRGEEMIDAATVAGATIVLGSCTARSRRVAAEAPDAAVNPNERAPTRFRNLVEPQLSTFCARRTRRPSASTATTPPRDHDGGVRRAQELRWIPTHFETMKDNRIVGIMLRGDGVEDPVSDTLVHRGGHDRVMRGIWMPSGRSAHHAAPAEGEAFRT